MLGSAAVPLGLVNAGGALGRLRIRHSVDSEWRSSIAIALIRLVIVPAICIPSARAIFNKGYLPLETARILCFLIMLER